MIGLYSLMDQIPEHITFAQMFSSLSSAEWLATATNLGFVFSFLAFWQAKRAKKAASDAKAAVYSIDSVSEITKAISILNDIQAHLRHSTLQIVPDKLITVHGHLTTVRKGCPGLTTEDKDDLLGVCNQTISTKNSIERELESEVKQYKFSKTNRILSMQAEKLQEILETIKRRY